MYCRFLSFLLGAFLLCLVRAFLRSPLFQDAAFLCIMLFDFGPSPARKVFSALAHRPACGCAKPHSFPWIGIGLTSRVRQKTAPSGTASTPALLHQHHHSQSGPPPPPSLSSSLTGSTPAPSYVYDPARRRSAGGHSPPRYYGGGE
jgi:hypothetical protein